MFAEINEIREIEAPCMKFHCCGTLYSSSLNWESGMLERYLTVSPSSMLEMTRAKGTGSGMDWHP
jgi:hypothetical protein